MKDSDLVIFRVRVAVLDGEGDALVLLCLALQPRVHPIQLQLGDNRIGLGDVQLVPVKLTTGTASAADMRVGKRT